MKYKCNYCGEEYPYEPVFCNDCGTRFSAISFTIVKSREPYKNVKVNIHLLPTKKSELAKCHCSSHNGQLLYQKGNTISQQEASAYNPQYLCFTLPESDLKESKINPGDWIVHFSHGKRSLHQVASISDNELTLTDGWGCLKQYSEKVIASSSKSLKTIIPQRNDSDSAYDLSLIPESFINYYIINYNKGEVIKEIEIKLGNNPRAIDYLKGIWEDDWEIKVNLDNEVCIAFPETRKYNKEELIAFANKAIYDYIGTNGANVKSNLKLDEKWIEIHLK